MIGTERKPQTGWRRGWDSNPERILITGKLLISHDGKTVENGRSGTTPYNFVQKSFY